MMNWSLGWLPTFPRGIIVLSTRCLPSFGDVSVGFTEKGEPATSAVETNCCALTLRGTATYIYPQSILKSSPFFLSTGCSLLPAFNTCKLDAVYFWVTTGWVE